MIRINNVSKSYGKLKAVNNISFKVNPGEIYSFLGPNGAGKTTTIKMCCGLLKPDSGSIEINNYDITKSPIEAKKAIGYVPDDLFLYKELTGLQFLRFVADVYRVPAEKREENIEYYLKLFELADKANEMIGSYSQGMRRKIGLISGVIHSPKVLLLDEPTLGLDAYSAKTAKDMIRDFAKNGSAVILTTHIMEIAEQISNRIGIISKGNIIAEGSLEEIKQNSEIQTNLEDVFITLTKEKEELVKVNGDEDEK
jgi:ABC-2 type transport system ATP-binding protein